jgi:hypothetical protein
MRRVSFFLVVTFALTWALWYLAASGTRAPFGIEGAVFLLRLFAPGIGRAALHHQDVVPAALPSAMTVFTFSGTRVAWWSRP